MDFQNGNAWLNDVRDAVRGGELVEPPEWVKERARRLFKGLALATWPTPHIINRIRASLVRDSRRHGFASAGVRSLGAHGGPWQLLYRGGNVDVDLLVRPNQDGRTINLRGQALAIEGHSVGSGIVEALPADQPRRLEGRVPPSARSRLEASGEFALPNLARGRYDVFLRFGAEEIELSGVEL
jgi:hypothetical protein